MAMTADFLPPRQTGRADFPHPAFAGRYCAGRSQVNKPQLFEMSVERDVCRRSPTALFANKGEMTPPCGVLRGMPLADQAFISLSCRLTLFRTDPFSDPFSAFSLSDRSPGW
jgi:hypothetical protein